MQPQAQPAPTGGNWFENSYNNHKLAWSIGLAAVGILVTLYLFARSSGSASTASTGASSSTDSGTPVANDTSNTSTEGSDYNSIIQTLQGLISSLPQSIASAVGTATSSLPGQTATAVQAILPTPTMTTSPISPSAPTSNPVSTAAASLIHYTVKPGDSMFSIINQFGESAAAFKETPGNWTASHNGLQGTDTMNGYYWPVHSGEIFTVYPGKQ